MPPPLFETLHLLLKKKFYRVNKSYLKENLCTHPEYPSIEAITDVLDSLKIENMAIKINKEKIQEIPRPFIAHMYGYGGEFTLIENIPKQTSTFYKRWDGVCVAIQENTNKEPKSFKTANPNIRFKNIHLAICAIPIFIIIIWKLIESKSLLNSLLFLTSALGIIIAYLIVTRELGIHNKLANQLCGTEGNCSTKIKSNKLGMPFLQNMSDYTIIYFSFTSLFLLLSLFTDLMSTPYLFLLLVSSCTLPITILSLYLQRFVLKQWCTLCIIIIAVLWSQFAILAILLPEKSIALLSYRDCLLSVAILISISAFWTYLKSFYKAHLHLENEYYKNTRLKYNYSIIRHILNQQRRVNTDAIKAELQIGDPNSHIQLIIASNPFCMPCSKLHNTLHEIAENEQIGISIRFTYNNFKQSDQKGEAVKLLLSICKDQNKHYKQQLLKQWYEEMNLSKLQAINYNMHDLTEELTILHNWTQEANIKYTPTIFINGYEFPQMYDTQDLIKIIKTLKKNWK